MKYSNVGVNINFRLKGNKTVFNKIDEIRCIELRSIETPVKDAVCLNGSTQVTVLK